MAAAEARVVWQRAAVNRHIHEDVVKAPKLAHCPSLKKQDSHSYYLGNNWDSLDTKVDLLRQINSSTHRDYRSEYFGGEDVCGMQFKPSLQVLVSERDNTKGYKGAPSENAVRNDDDLGWQFFMDPNLKSTYASEREPLDRKFDGDNLASSLVEDGKEKPTGADETIDGSIMAQEILRKILPEYSDHSSISSFEVESSKTSENVGIHGKKEVDYMVSEQSTWSVANTPFSKAGSSWRTADKETLVGLVAQRTSEKLENCDLPTPRSGFKCKTSLDNLDMLEDTPLDVSKSLDRKLLASVFQDDGKVSCLKDLGLQTSTIHGRLEPTLTIIPSTTTRPINIYLGPNTPAHTHLSKSYSSVDHKNTSWSGNGQGTSSLSSKGGLSPIAEALCHSQTRAREAEQKVDEATKECKRLSNLYSREASLSLMYRYWVTSLQAENTWLKMCLNNPQGAIWLKHSFSSASAVLDHLSKNPWRHFKKENFHRRMLRYFSSIWQPRDSTNSTGRNDHGDTNIILGCTIGFAFVLGFTLAGAGLALGWRMGWILIPS